MALLGKILGGHESEIKPASATAPVGAPPDKRSIYQNRFHYGVNFGSLFLLEKFIFHQFFIDDTNTEFDAINAYIKANGKDKTRSDLENHWSSYVNDDDWNWLKSKGVTSIRLPIGYWHINGGLYTSGTPFSSIASVYKNSWSILKQIIEKAKEYEIGVLIDLHALPGGANNSEHSGLKLSKAGFWNSSSNEKSAIAALEFITNELKGFENFIGLQIVNESVFDKSASGQRHYYTKAIKHIRKIDDKLPIIISDGWWPAQWVQWVNEKESKFNGQSIGVVIDTHVYRCFSDTDKCKPPEKIVEDLNKDLLNDLDGQADLIVGEFSHVLDGQSWDKAQHDRNELVKEYGNTLYQLFKQRAKGGFFFWTFKFQEGDGGEWGFKPQVESGNIPSRPTQPNRSSSQEDFEKIAESELQAHSNYWDGQNSKENYEHWRYKEGFLTGWSDAIEFSKFNGSTIGRIKAWSSSRRIEHIDHRGNSKFLWEWDQGFEKGIEKAQEFVL